MKKNFFLVFLDTYKWVFLIIIIYLIILFIYTYGTYFEKVITVKELNYVKNFKQGTNIITDSDNDIYTIHNSVLYGFFTSVELFTKININETYKIRGYGFRIPILGYYKNIIGAEKI
jgi:hypothetical protein